MDTPKVVGKLVQVGSDLWLDIPADHKPLVITRKDLNRMRMDKLDDTLYDRGNENEYMDKAFDGCPFCGSYEGDYHECPECGYGQ